MKYLHAISTLHQHNPWGFWLIAILGGIVVLAAITDPAIRLLRWVKRWIVFWWAIALFSLGVID